jgi:hypothetical protein
LDGLVEGDLAKGGTSVRVCGEKTIPVWIDKNANGQRTDAQQYLRGDLVLAIKHSHSCTGPVIWFWQIEPAKANMKLRITRDCPGKC